MKLKIPELPPRHRVDISTDEEFICIKVRGTTWYAKDPSAEEVVASASLQDGVYRVDVWKLTCDIPGRRRGEWVDLQKCETAQEAIDYMCAAVMMGMADYTLLEDENA